MYVADSVETTNHNSLHPYYTAQHTYRVTPRNKQWSEQDRRSAIRWFLCYWRFTFSHTLHIMFQIPLVQDLHQVFVHANYSKFHLTKLGCCRCASPFLHHVARVLSQLCVLFCRCWFCLVDNILVAGRGMLISVPHRRYT